MGRIFHIGRIRRRYYCYNLDQTPPLTSQSDSSPPIPLDFPFLITLISLSLSSLTHPHHFSSSSRLLSHQLSFSVSLMATTNTTHHHHYNHHRHRRHHSPSFINKPASLSFRQSYSSTTVAAASAAAGFSLSSSSSDVATTSAAAASSVGSVITFDVLAHHLSNRDFRQADEETRRLLIQFAGESAQKRGYVFFSEVQFVSRDDLRAIDDLWTKHSDGRFGYSVQRRIWSKVKGDFTRFFIKVGWMKKLDTEVEQYNYRSFPEEFTWELNDETPEGHLPLTNALRGTQLLKSILSHPAFETGDGDEEEEGDESGMAEEESRGSVNGGVGKEKTTSKRVFKTDYSF